MCYNYSMTTSNDTTVNFLVINEGKTNERVETVRPLKTVDGKTLVAFIRGARIDTKWVSTHRIASRGK